MIENQRLDDDKFKESWALRKYQNEYNATVREQQLKFAKFAKDADIQYNGRMSPWGKEDLYREYQKGMSVKDLSLKFGILP